VRDGVDCVCWAGVFRLIRVADSCVRFLSTWGGFDVTWFYLCAGAVAATCWAVGLILFL
jgi:hypothetical protein